MATSAQPLPSSYRDPSGFMFRKNGRLFRQVNRSYSSDYELLMSSGLYDSLVSERLLIPHRQSIESGERDPEAFLVLEPDTLPFISYPWEWSFDMLKDAALLTLQLLKEAMKYGMILKDATAFNIQFSDGRPVFIDTLSFEKYEAAMPWIAYRQYCECFLGPLLLMHYSKQSLHQLMLAYPEGIPLAVTRSLLPWRSRFSLHVWLHIHLHAKVSAGNKAAVKNNRGFSKKKLDDLITSLEILTKKVSAGNQRTTWSGYYEEASQRHDYLEKKKIIVKEWINEAENIETAVDLGANDGSFSEFLSNRGIFTIAADFDPLAINNLYIRIKEKNSKLIQPLVIDLSNPSPSIGFENKERDSFNDRLKADLALALALVHHLAIGKNIPLSFIASYFSVHPKISSSTC